jgi:hypothetical protein
MCSTFQVGKYFRVGQEDAMTEYVHPAEAQRALDEIRDRQRQVVTGTPIPAWFWAATAGLMVTFTAGIESRRPVLVAIVVPIFAVGLAATVLGVVLRSRAQVRRSYLGRPGALAIVGFVLAAVVAGLATAFGLAWAGFDWPATAGNAAAGLVLIAGGPLLMRRLGRIMAQRAERSPQGPR